MIRRDITAAQDARIAIMVHNALIIQCSGHCGHGIAERHHQIDLMKRIVEWLERHVT